VNGKQLVLQAMRHETVERVPWVPYTGVHIASLKGYRADDILTSEKKLLECLLTSNAAYSPDGQPLLFDLQVEAEVLGCGLKWDAKAPPSVVEHPLAASDELDLGVPEKDAGRLPMVLRVAQRFRAEVGARTALFGLFCGPLTLASHLRGTRFFLDFKRNESYAHRLIEFTTSVARRMADYYLEAGMDVLAVVDPLISQISPKYFTQFFSEPFSRIFEHIRGKGAPSSFFVCGDATKNVEVMCQTGPDAIAIDENIDIVRAKEITDRYNITISGNIPLTAVMLLGNQQDNQKCAIDLIDVMGRRNFILAPGCDIPYAVPEQNVIGIGQAVQNVEQTRKFLENYVREEIDLEVDMPDYAHLDRPFVEVFTIDSLTCAACTYMKATAFQMKELLGDRVEVVERKSTELETIVRMSRLGVKNLPAILINGEVRFSSIIPDRDALKAELEQLL
jgi:uroporphyrinogen decarboxylase